MTTPEDSPNRDQRITLRVTEAERAAIEESAEAADRSVSAHIRETATEGSDTRWRVPPVNNEIWYKFDDSNLPSNLNQIAAQANAFRARVADSPLSPELVERAVEILSAVGDTADELRDLLERVRTDLRGTEPLDLAADVLEDYRQATRTGRLDLDAEKLSTVAAYLRALAERRREEGV
jgi:hypothetical protein